MISIFQLRSQATVVVTTVCNLKCSFCPLWKDDVELPPYQKDFVSLIKDGLFFKVYPRATVMNVVGGEVLVEKDLLFLLTFLKSEKIAVRLWSNGLFPLETWRYVMPLIDHLFLYCPSSEPERYRDISGVDGLSLLDDAITFIKGFQKPITLHYHIRQDTIQYLPEMYDFAYDRRLPLYLHYWQSETLSKESLTYIKRFYRIKGVSVFKTRQPESPVCAAYPFMQGDYSWPEITQSLKEKFSFYYELIKLFG